MRFQLPVRCGMLRPKVPSDLKRDLVKDEKRSNTQRSASYLSARAGAATHSQLMMMKEQNRDGE
jgi:hypothetical protein